MRQSGVTLVELLVSIALSALTLVAALQVVGTGLGSSADSAAFASVNDKAHHTMLLIGSAVRRAGYLGCGGPTTEIRDLLRAPLADSPELDLSHPYEVLRIAPEGEASPDLSRLPSSAANSVDGRFGINVDQLLPGNDALIVRGLGFRALPLLSDTVAGAAIKVPSRRGISRGDFVAISDCQHLQVFRLSGYQERSDHSLLRRASGLGSHDNQASKLLAGRSFTVTSRSQPRLHAIETEIFFIAQSRGSSDLAALWRKETHKRPLEIAEGITDLDLREIEDAHGHGLGIRVRFAASSSQVVAGKRLERRFVRHFAFENLP